MTESLENQLPKRFPQSNGKERDFSLLTHLNDILFLHDKGRVIQNTSLFFLHLEYGAFISKNRTRLNVARILHFQTNPSVFIPTHSAETPTFVYKS